MKKGTKVSEGELKLYRRFAMRGLHKLVEGETTKKEFEKSLKDYKKGWRMESARHSLAAKGLKTGRKIKLTKADVRGYIKLKEVAKKVREEKLTTQQRLDQNNPIEVWETPDKSWRWEIYKKYQKDDDKQYARAFCKVFSPITREQMSSGYELGDVYISEIKSVARKVSG